MNRSDYFSTQLDILRQKDQYRRFPQIHHNGKFVEQNGHQMLNLASNDYLGLAGDVSLQQAFLKKYIEKLPHFTSSSSRLLTGNFPEYEALEQLMANAFRREACLLFNSGYHANIGILPAVANKQTLIVADKLVHASIIDGIRLSNSPFLRYRHNDYDHLYNILHKQYLHYERIIVMTESVFSMDGDLADLSQLVAFKKQFDNVMLYVDEAHGIGVYGERGLGVAEQTNCLPDIDFLVGTFGKAFASMGAYVVCDRVIKDYLINTMRPLIFSTALPPFNVAWTTFLFEKQPHFQAKRQHLMQLSARLRQVLAEQFNMPMPSESHIVPYILGENQRTIKIAHRLQQCGYYCLPIRPPTVPVGTSRIRLSLTADMTHDEIEQFIEQLFYAISIN
ncbi:8-amino-7-oxononanoate synthase [Aggregatibacter actinomycetemcomitans]|uniref:8-amino-7-oxononanoate synthase n=1 Tax=Aggregatibacter actinomycetemcomitans TaxID=714 RepID=UPI002020979F|nr:8-amino-7-oxononanoate synthase [Aggregatibacter actinomycetemcomitans]